MSPTWKRTWGHLLSYSRPLPFEDHLVVSDSKISVTSTNVTLIWPYHIDLSLVSPFPSHHHELHTDLIRGTCTLSSPMDTIVSNVVMNSYPCPSNAFSPSMLQNMCLLTPVQPYFFNFFNSILSLPPFSTILRFFRLFHFFIWRKKTILEGKLWTQVPVIFGRWREKVQDLHFFFKSSM